MRIISDAEVEYIVRGCSLGVRSDGRGALDYRHVLVESDIFPHCAGSSRVTIGNAVDVVCGVKVVVMECSSGNNEYVQCSVDFSPSCNLKLDEKSTLKFSSHISSIITASVVNCCGSYFPNLDIISGKYYWRVNIDLLVMQCDGNPVDACSFATYNALKCTHIPKTEAFVGESGQLEDFDISGEVVESAKFEPSSLPLVVTVTKVDKDVLILDVNLSEESCACASIAIAVTCEGNEDKAAKSKICGIYKNGGGSFSSEELLIAANHARLAGKTISPHLDEVHQVTRDQDQKYPDHPPSRVGLLA